jgi:hypothetical protein
MNKLVSGYNDDERGHYNFSFSDSDGKHISVSFRAEPDYDLDIVFSEFKNFLIASGHDVENEIGEIYPYDESDEDDDEPPTLARWTADYENEMAKQYQSKDKFSMENFPNNGWPFGDLTTASIPALTTADIAPLTVTNLDTNQTYAYKDVYGKFPTMSPITTQQIQAWSLSSADIQSLTVSDLSTWKTDAPGTLGGAKIEFK